MLRANGNSHSPLAQIGEIASNKDGPRSRERSMKLVSSTVRRTGDFMRTVSGTVAGLDVQGQSRRRMLQALMQG